jgi:hypothetical protein
MAVDSITARPTSVSYTSAPPASTLTPSSDHESMSELEGELSLNAHAVYATEYVQQAMTRATPDVSQEVESSLVALHHVVHAKPIEKGHEKGTLAPSPRMIDGQAASHGCRLPPMELTMSCLQRLKGSIHHIRT